MNKTFGCIPEGCDITVQALACPVGADGAAPPTGGRAAPLLPAPQPQSKTAQVPGESVTATATPVLAAWSTGDGTTITCNGPGTPYGGGNPAAASPTCGHTYGIPWVQQF